MRWKMPCSRCAISASGLRPHGVILNQRWQKHNQPWIPLMTSSGDAEGQFVTTTEPSSRLLTRISIPRENSATTIQSKHLPRPKNHCVWLTFLNSKQKQTIKTLTTIVVAVAGTDRI